MQTTSPKAVIYTRVSSKSQLEGGGLGSQESRCKQYIKGKGRTYIKTFTEKGVSGGLLERGAMVEALNFIEKYNNHNLDSPIKYLVCDDIDRFARDVEIHLALKKELIIRGVKLESLNQRLEDTPEGKMIETVFASFAELHRTKNRAQVINRQQARLLDGYRTFDYPIGYKTIEAPGGGKLLVKEEPYASIVQEGLELFASDILKTQLDLAHFREDKGLRKKVHRSAVSHMLKNILYAGYIQYERITKDKKTGETKHEWKVPLRKAKHEGIISLDTYNKIQEKVSKTVPYTQPKEKENKDYPLRGKIVCECCGLGFSSGSSKGNGGKYPYYTFSKNCIYKGKGIRADSLHLKFDELLTSMQIKPVLKDILQRMLIDEIEQHIALQKETVKQNKKRLKALKSTEQNIVEKIIESKNPLVTKRLEEELGKITLEITAIEEQYEVSNDKEQEKELLTIGLDIMCNPKQYRDEGNQKDKKMLLELLFRSPLQIKKESGGFGTIPNSPIYEVNQVFTTSNGQLLEMIGIEPMSERDRNNFLPLKLFN